MKRFLAAMVMVTALMCTPCSSYAQDGDMGSLITTSLLGTGIGLLAGTAAMVFTDNPGDHDDRAAYGAAIGFACGFALGLSGMITPSYSSAVNTRGETEHIYGLNVHIPFK